MKQVQVLLLDFGGQYTHLIARRVRETGVFCEIVPYTIPLARIKAKGPKAIILSGGPSSVYEKGAPRIKKEVFDLPVPILGICYGMQLISLLLNGTTKKFDKGEYGLQNLKSTGKSPLLAGTKKDTKIWMSHKDVVIKTPQGFKITSRTETIPIASMERENIYGIQFHPEVTHTRQGNLIFKNFIFKIAKCKKDWDPSKILQRVRQDILQKTENKKVLCAVSGGVDSTIMTSLLYKTIGKRLKPVFINNGVLRKDEEKEVLHNLRNVLKIPVKYINASQIFLRQLRGAVDPEKKRKIIGKVFVDVFFKHLQKGDLLAQGTLYPDVIESVSVVGPSATIKTHHNRVKEILQLIKEDRVIEPFKLLFKDEVRIIGKQMGIPEAIIWRMPFPGPGLAIRILGEVTKGRLAVLKEADYIIRYEIEKNMDYRKIWQAFGVLLPVKSVGVMGDSRTYQNVIAIRAVESLDGMTADWVKLPYPLLQKISNRIINEVDGINRVVYDTSSKPPATIEWE
ncbi:MAG: glutamine-hydrolyzing GMP synthase [Spirochaetes bacterium]|nr:glutamine-hydrolyzing GMP synthase [Spirochaetota bacterium]